jgi:cytochrome P450
MMTYDADKVKKIKSVTLFGLLPYIRLFRSNPLEGFTRLTKKKGDFFKISLFGQELYFVNKPEYIEHILKENYLNYPRAHTLEPFADLLGEGLFRSEDELWKKMQKTLRPAFHQKQIQQYFTTIVEEATDFWEQNFPLQEKSTVANIELEMKRLTLKVSSRLLLSPQLEINTDPVIDALSDIMESADLAHHTRHKLKVALSRTLPLNRKTPRIVREAFDYLQGLAQQILEEFFTKEAEKGVFLQLLYDAYKAGEINVDQAVHEIKTMFFASFDTVAGGLTWALYSIDKVPGLRKRLEEEVDLVFPDGTIQMDDLPKLKLLTQTIKESLRLYPPAWSFHRVSLREDIIDGYVIPRNAWLMISPFTLHRNETLWPEPEKFDIDRFANEDDSLPVRYDYLPFGQGPHICIGNRLALFEMTIILATILQRSRISFRLKGKPVFKSFAILQSTELILNTISSRQGRKAAPKK